MESHEADIKPTILIDDIRDKSLTTAQNGSKLKQSRYEDVWPEEVHAAFMEAVALYPPMGKRRLKYYRVPTHDNQHFSDTNRARSFGRCQLIQSYILEKTGKNRSRKQVSSHLQRLKKIHKDNPTLRPLFAECLQSPSEDCSGPQAVAISSQDIFANISFSTRHFKSDFDLTVNVQNVDNDTDSSPAFPHVSEVSSFNGGSRSVPDLSTNFHDQSSNFIPQELLSPQQNPVHAFHPSASDQLSEIQDPSAFKDGGFRNNAAFNTSTFSISMRRLASRLPIQGRADSYSTSHFSRALSSELQPAHEWISYDGLIDGIPWDPPLTPAQHWFYTPFHTASSFPAEKKRIDSVPVSDWTWPQNSDNGPDHRESTLDDISCYPPTIIQPNSTCPMRVHSPRFHSSPPESEAPQLPQGISYTYVPATISESVSADSATSFSGQVIPASPEYFALPQVIRPTPTYPVSYIHTDGHTTAPNLLPS